MKTTEDDWWPLKMTDDDEEDWWLILITDNVDDHYRWLMTDTETDTVDEHYRWLMTDTDTDTVDDQWWPLEYTILPVVEGEGW